MTANATPLAPHDSRNSSPTATGTCPASCPPTSTYVSTAPQVVNYAQWRSPEAKREEPSCLLQPKAPVGPAGPLSC